MESRKRVRSGPIVGTILAAFLVVAMAGAALAQAPPDVKVESQNFDWLQAREDTATYVWSATVINETDRDYRVRVILELLDDDDQVVNKDAQGNPLDLVVINIDAGGSIEVRETGEIPYDVAADVVSIRFRRELVNAATR